MNLNHPFALDISDLEDLNLEFEQLTDEETAQIGGGEAMATTMAVGEEGGNIGGDIPATTKAVGEEGGGGIQCISAPCPGSETGGNPSPKPPKPPVTKTWLETGGGHYTKALNENGGPIYW